jgi:ABC-type amino acid transport substrate-binding protein
MSQSWGLRAVGVLLLVLASVAPAVADLKEIEARGSLRVLSISFDEVPVFYQVNHFDVELLDGFARLHKVKIEPVHVPTYGDLIPALLAGKGDLIAGGLTSTPARRKLIAFSGETFPSRMVAVTRKPHPPIATLDALRAEKRLGTEKGTSWAQATLDAGVSPANIDDTLLLQDLPEALRTGKVTGAVFEINAAIPATARDPELELGMFVGPPGSQGYGVRREDAALLGALDQYLESSRHTTGWNRLLVKYFGANAPEVLKRSRE